MSHATDWSCRSCRTPLGQVRDGVLRPLVPIESINGRGFARVPCPGCGRVRTWLPTPTASERLHTDRNVQIAASCERDSGP